MEIFHPGGQERDFLHFFFGNVAGADRAAAVGEEDVKVASVITDIQDRGVLRYIFLSYYCDFGSCDPQDKSKYSLNDPKRADILGHWREFADDPFHQKNRDRQHQISDDNDTDKYKSNHVFCPFYIVMQFCILTPLYEEFSIVAINLSRIT